MGEVLIDVRRWMRDRLWSCTDTEILSLDDEKLLGAFLDDLKQEFIRRNTIRETIGLIRQEQGA